MKEQNLVCCLSVILYIYAKLGRKRPRFNMFASLTKHVCKPKLHHLKIVNMPFMKPKHSTYDAQTWNLRCANIVLP